MAIGIVTGASSGLGKEFVLELDQENLDAIWVIARRKERLTELSQKVSTPLVLLPLDISRKEDLSFYKEKLAQEKPEVSYLVNCAGLGRFGSSLTIPYGEAMAMVHVNMAALTAVTLSTLPYCRPGCRILQMSSMAGFAPIPYFALYSASKTFVTAFSRSLHRELAGKKITVTAVCPGPVATEFFDEADRFGPTLGIGRKKLSAKRVVSLALIDAKRGKDLSVCGAVSKLMRLGAKVLPHRVILAFCQWRYPQREK